MYPIMIAPWPILDELEIRKNRLLSNGIEPGESKKSFDDWLDLELTYTSIAIEGNSLDRVETMIVLDNGTVPDKTLTEHLEAHNHRDALIVMHKKAKSNAPVSVQDALDMHRIILRGINDQNAGQLRPKKIRILGAEKPCILPEQVPAEMEKLDAWLSTAPMDPATAFKAHLWLVDIHPFVDGNGRTSRLLTNLILSKAGHLSVFVNPREQKPYFNTIRTFCECGDARPFTEFMSRRLLETYDEADSMVATPSPYRSASPTFARRSYHPGL